MMFEDGAEMGQYVYSEVPVGEMVKCEFRLTIGQRRFLTGATLDGAETKTDEYDENWKHTVYTYRVSGDIPNNSAYRIYRADAWGTEGIGDKDGNSWNWSSAEWDRNEFVFTYKESRYALNEYYYDYFPSEIVVYTNPVATFAADGSLTINIYYDYVTLPRP
jgi:hypothetical protein